MFKDYPYHVHKSGFSKKKRNSILWFFFLVLMVDSLPGNSAAQVKDPDPPANGYPDSLYSPILSMQRQFKVILPPDFQQGSLQKYDVMYVLDGSDWNTGTIAQVQHFVEDQGLMPPTIIVSVIHPDRNADLSPTHLDTWKNSGNADQFLRFLKNELIPYINKKYPSNGDNTLWGHSLSGMFVLYAMALEPALFKSYIAIDPSVWWDNAYVEKIAEAKLHTAAFQQATFFIAGRETDMNTMKIDSLETILKNKAPAGLKWKLNVYSGETHGSVKFKATYDGLRFIYDGYIRSLLFSPMHGIVLKDKPFKIFYYEDTANIHFTVNGTVPTNSSPKVAPEIIVNGPATVMYKALTNRSRYDRSRTGLFTDQQMTKPISGPLKNWRSGGFNFSYYEGTWDKWPDLSKLKPAKTGITDNNFDIEKLPRKNHFALVIDGLLESNEEGYYIFGIGGGEKDTKLYIDNQLVISFRGEGDDSGQTCVVPLSKGFYPFRIEFNHQQETESWNAFDWQQYLTPGIMNTQNTIHIPVNLQYGRK